MANITELFRLIKEITGYGTTRMTKAIWKASGVEGVPSEKTVARWISGESKPRENNFNECTLAGLLNNYCLKENLTNGQLLEKLPLQLRNEISADDDNFIGKLSHVLFKTYYPDNSKRKVSRSDDKADENKNSKSEHFQTLRSTLTYQAAMRMMECSRRDMKNWHYEELRDDRAIRYSGEGYYKDGKFYKSGYGQYDYDNGEQYYGGWVDNLRSGICSFIGHSPDKGDYVFQGEFKCDYPHQGTITYEDGTEEYFDIETEGHVFPAFSGKAQDRKSSASGNNYDTNDTFSKIKEKASIGIAASFNEYIREFHVETHEVVYSDGWYAGEGYYDDDYFVKDGFGQYFVFDGDNYAGWWKNNEKHGDCIVIGCDAAHGGEYIFRGKYDHNKEAKGKTLHKSNQSECAEFDPSVFEGYDEYYRLTSVLNDFDDHDEYFQLTDDE